MTPTPLDNEKLRAEIETKLDDYFRHTLELRPDEDIPACASDLFDLFHQALEAREVEAVLSELNYLHRNQGQGLPKRDYDNEADEIIHERIEIWEASIIDLDALQQSSKDGK